LLPQRARRKFTERVDVPLLQARRDGLHNFGFGIESNSTTHDVEVTHVVFVSLLNADILLARGGPRPALLPRGGPRPALAQLHQSQSQAADVPECNYGGGAVVRALGGATISSSPMSSRPMSSSPMSPGEISTSSLSGRSGLAGLERTRGSVR
jgi:hypothetical protein